MLRPGGGGLKCHGSSKQADTPAVSEQRSLRAGSAQMTSGSRMGANKLPYLGELLRHERMERSLSQRELARRLDVSASLVSQIETGKTRGSVRTLQAIATEFGLSMNEMIDSTERAERQLSGSADERFAASGTEDDLGCVQRRQGRRSLDLEAGVRWERLTVRDEPGVEFLYAEYPPHSESVPADALIRHDGREFALVLKGRLGLTIGFEEYTLAPGDSAFFDSTTPHRLHNDGDQAVEAIWIVLGRHAEHYRN
jgi:transcriptional regulator with XRE-family HTH domain